MAGGFCVYHQLGETAPPNVPGAVSSLESSAKASALKRIDTLTNSMKGLPFWFMPLWCTVMPVTSFLLIPSVQGTIPAYMLAFASAFFVLMSRNDGQSSAQRCRYLAVALVVAGIWLLLFCGSQLGHLLSNRHDFGELSLINPN